MKIFSVLTSSALALALAIPPCVCAASSLETLQSNTNESSQIKYTSEWFTKYVADNLTMPRHGIVVGNKNFSFADIIESILINSYGVSTEKVSRGRSSSSDATAATKYIVEMIENLYGYHFGNQKLPERFQISLKELKSESFGNAAIAFLELANESLEKAAQSKNDLAAAKEKQSKEKAQNLQSGQVAFENFDEAVIALKANTDLVYTYSPPMNIAPDKQIYGWMGVVVDYDKEHDMYICWSSVTKSGYFVKPAKTIGTIRVNNQIKSVGKYSGNKEIHFTDGSSRLLPILEEAYIYGN